MHPGVNQRVHSGVQRSCKAPAPICHCCCPCQTLLPAGRTAGGVWLLERQGTHLALAGMGFQVGCLF
jgi:hypothetical protein